MYLPIVSMMLWKVTTEITNQLKLVKNVGSLANMMPGKKEYWIVKVSIIERASL